MQTTMNNAPIEQTTHKVYIVFYVPEPGRFESEIPTEEVVDSDTLTKVFTDFQTAKKYHEQLCIDLGCEDDEEVAERVHFIVKNITH